MKREYQRTCPCLFLRGRRRGITIQICYVQCVERAALFHLAFCEQMVKTKMWWSCCIVCPLLSPGFLFVWFVFFPSLIPSVFSFLPQGYSLRVVEPTLSLTLTTAFHLLALCFSCTLRLHSLFLSFLRHHSCIWLPWTVAAIWAGSLSPRTVHGHTGNSARKWNRYWKKGPSCSTPTPLPTTPFIPALFIPDQCLLFLHIPSLCTSHPIPPRQGWKLKPVFALVQTQGVVSTLGRLLVHIVRVIGTHAS